MPYYAIVDPGRRSYVPYTYESIEDYAESAFSIGSFSFDLWQMQQARVEVWCEKDGQMQFLEQATEKYRVPFYITKGYSSYNVKADAARRLQQGYKRVILYCGDFDSTGLDIECDLVETLKWLGCFPLFQRVGFKQSQLATLQIHSGLKVKQGDSRSKHFIETYGVGQLCYELEAMAASTLLTTLQQAIEKHIDTEAWNNALAYEQFVNEQAKIMFDP